MEKLRADEALLRATSYVQSAIRLYEEILENDPNNQQVSVTLDLLRSGRFESFNLAQQSINELVELYQQGELASVVDAAIRLAEEHPTSYTLWNILGAANKSLGRLSEAEHAFRKAVELDSLNPAAHNNLGVILQDQQKLDDAAASFARAIEMRPDYAEAHYNLGGLLYLQGELDEATASYQRAVLLKPDYTDAHYNLGDLFRERGNLHEAGASYQRATLLNPDDADAHNKFGVTLRDLGLPNQDQSRLEEAAASFQRALELEPNFAEAHYNLGVVRRAQGKHDEAAARFQSAVQIKPDYADAHNSLGVTFQEQGNFDQAKDSFQQAIISNSYCTDAHRNLSSLIKYTEDDEHLRDMVKLYDDANIGQESRGMLCLALSKAFEDVGDIETSFRYISEVNNFIHERLENKHNYKFYRDRSLFAKAKMVDLELPESSHFNYETSLTPIFIVGMPRSGTTLVEQIISSHSRVKGLGETLHLWNPVWSSINTEEIFSDHGIDQIRRQYMENVTPLTSGYEFLTDKMIQNFLLIGVIMRALPEAKIIHIRRDPRAVCWSNYKSLLGAGLEYSYNLNNIVDYYNLYSNIMRHWNKRYPDKIYNLDYEDLIANQEGETRSLIEHLGLDWEHSCLEFYKNKRAVTTNSFHQVRQGIFAGSSESWRKFVPFLDGAFDRLALESKLVRGE